MNRRSFFKLLVGAAAARVIEPVARTYFFAPPAGWELNNGIWASNGPLDGGWASKTPLDILADINYALSVSWYSYPKNYSDLLANHVALVRRPLPRTWWG